MTENLIGKRAIIKTPQGYSKFLHGRKGTISKVNDQLYLNFDKPAYRHKGDTMPMSGVYLEPESFKLMRRK